MQTRNINQTLNTKEKQQLQLQEKKTTGGGAYCHAHWGV